MELDIETIFRAIGVFGFGLYVMNYSMLARGTLTSASLKFFSINIIAASCVLASNYTEFNLASVMIQIFWIIIGTYAILHRRKSNHRLSQP